MSPIVINSVRFQFVVKIECGGCNDQVIKHRCRERVVSALNGPGASALLHDCDSSGVVELIVG